MPEVMPVEEKVVGDGEDPYCELCKFIITNINNIIKENRTEVGCQLSNTLFLSVGYEL
jgi:hypothetical protein